MALIEELQALEAMGYVRAVAHKTLDLKVWNYTPQVAFDNVFATYPLLSECRGLVTDLNGEIKGRGFTKFFNWEQHQPEDFPNSDEPVEITEKMDGSLLIVFRYKNQIVYTTRGSFYSDQALAGAELFRKIYNEDWIEEGYSYLFEIIAPWNRIVVSYDSEDLVHLAKLNTSNGFDLPRDERFKLVSVHQVDGGVWSKELFEKLKELDIPNKEGFVLKCKRENEIDFRVKVKYDTYCQLHRIVTGISNKDIWERLSRNQNFDELLELCPDEFYQWVKKVKAELYEAYSLVENEAKSIYDSVKHLPTRKEQAESLKGYKYNSIVFKMIDGSNYDFLVWKMVKPEKYSQPFVNRDEEA